MERLVGVKLAFVSLDWNDGVSKGTSTVKKTDDSRPIKKQNKNGREEQLMTWHRRI